MIQGKLVEMRSWYVYILTNSAHTFYVGSTNNLIRRWAEHQSKVLRASFTARYTFTRVVYFELLPTEAEALAREKQIKRWSRAKKFALIETLNPTWDDLSARWHDPLRLG